MPRFIVRMVLHVGSGSSWEYYEKLHGCMDNQGFSQLVEGRKGVYHLPDAEYTITGEFTATQVLAKAKTAAKEVGLDYAAFVTQVAACAWYGLKNVDLEDDDL